VADESILRRLLRGAGRFLSAARTFTANLLFLVLVLVVLTLLLRGPGSVPVPEGAALVVAPEGRIVEQVEQLAPLGRLFSTEEVASETAFRDLAEALTGARDDARIRLVVLDLDQLTGVSLAHLEALGAALSQIRASGKEVIAVGDGYSQGQYYLAAHASTIYLHPMGQVLLEGFGAFQLYFKDALEKLKVNVHVFRVGEYKAAVEPFTRDSMSPEAREANQTLVDELWQDYVGAVAANRKLTPDSVNRYVEQFPDLLANAKGDMARLALEQGFVDELASRDQMRARLIDLVGERDRDFLKIGASDYAQALRQERSTRSDAEIGVIVAAGTIQMGEKPRGQIGADTLSGLIRRARLDESVRALVLRVDSPGGSAFASEVIRQELELLQLAGKPLVVSMAGAAASGGYWISATADEIWAAPSTITGSIGIFGIVPTFEESLAAIGVGRDGVGSTSLAGALDPLRGLDEPVSRVFQATVENGYTRFLNLVARGRDMLPEEVDRVGQGRVWSGRHALELHLVDGLGHLDDAVSAAARRAGLERYTVRYIEKPLSAREQLIAQLAGSLGLAPADALQRIERQVRGAIAPWLRFDDPASVYALCGSCLIRVR
jgi:protease-4